MKRSSILREVSMASSRNKSSAVTGKKASSSRRVAGGRPATGIVKAEHGHKVVRRSSAVRGGTPERGEPYPAKTAK
jgi:hypothetical protein